MQFSLYHLERLRDDGEFIFCRACARQKEPSPGSRGGPNVHSSSNISIDEQGAMQLGISKNWSYAKGGPTRNLRHTYEFVVRGLATLEPAIAFTLSSDMWRWLAESDAHASIADFSTGQYEAPDRVLIPKKLYGRAREVDTCLMHLIGWQAVESESSSLQLVNSLKGADN